MQKRLTKAQREFLRWLWARELHGILTTVETLRGHQRITFQSLFRQGLVMIVGEGRLFQDRIRRTASAIVREGEYISG